MPPTTCVFAPNLILTVTLEIDGDNGDTEIHLHPGGQGFWVARMLAQLGVRPVVCGPVGGETGEVLSGLVERWGVHLVAMSSINASPAVVYDRRGGDREVIAESKAFGLDRHAHDDAYSTFLELAMTSDVAVVTGQNGEVFPTGSYRRLAHDLGSAGVEVVGDLHGPELAAWLDGGPIRVLKVSDEDLMADGIIGDTTEASALAAIRELTSRGAEDVVVTRADRPVLALIGGGLIKATPPRLEPADFRGAGDSMTAGLAAALLRSLDPQQTIRLACGAGAANVARHGLGSGTEALINELAERVEIEELSGSMP